MTHLLEKAGYKKDWLQGQPEITGLKTNKGQEIVCAFDVFWLDTSHIMLVETRNPTSELKLPEKRPGFDSAIRHSGIVNKISITPNNVWNDVSISEVSFNQNSELETIDISPTKDSISSINVSQIGSFQIGFSQVTPTQVGGIQISIPDNSTFQPSAFQGNTKQIGSSQIGFTQIGLSQIGSAQVDISQNSAFKVNRTVEGNTLGLNQLNPREVSFSVSIPSQQLLSSNFPSHDLLPIL